MSINLGWYARNIKKAIQDVFDPNTADDQARRMAAGQPRMYADQQRQAASRPQVNADPSQWSGRSFGPQVQQAPQRRNLFSKLYDQANPFDNNLTFKQEDPTQSKSAFQQLGQLGGQTARGITTVVPQAINSTAELGGDTVDLARAGVAQATGNWKARDAALNRGLQSKYSNPGQGLLGTGGLIDNETASKPIPTTKLAKTIAGKGVQGYAEVASLGTAGFAGKQLVNQGFKQGIKTQVPTLLKTGGLNFAQGAADAYNRGASTKDVLKSGLTSAALGTAADVGLGVAGAATSKLVRAGVDNLPTKPVFADFNGKVPNDPLEALKAEARKYKSAEEFVKAQGTTVYHRSPNKFDKFDLSKVSQDSNRQRYGWGMYFSDTVPHEQYGNYLYESRLPKGTLIDSKKPVDKEIVNKIVKAVKENNKNPSELQEFSYNGYLFYKTLSRILGGDKDASLFLSKNGVAGLKNTIGKNANDYILFNTDSIRTKAQLTDLYNQATAPQVGKTDPLSKFGWKSENTSQGTMLYNRNGKHVATITEKKGRYTAIHTDGTRIATGADPTKLADDVARKYFYATEVKPTQATEPVGGTLRPDKAPEPYTNPAIQSGLTAERARLVQENTNRTKAALDFDRQPTPKKAFHSTASLDIEGGKLRASQDGAMGEGVYLHTNPDTAKYAGAMQADGNMADQRALDVNLKTDNLFKWADQEYPTPDQVALIKKRGYDGIYKKDGEIVVFDPSKVDIANPPAQVGKSTGDAPMYTQGAIDAATPGPKSRRVKTSREAPTLNDYTDRIIQSTGRNIDEGLVGGNILYSNPVVSTYNKAVQGYRNLVDRGRDATTDVLQKGINSDNSVTSAVSRTPRGLFNNFGRSEGARGVLLKRTSALESSGKAAQIALKDIDEVVSALPDTDAHFKRIYQVLEDKDFLKKVYGTDKKLTVADLTPQERVAYDKLIEINKIRNDLNLDTGQITAKQHAKFADGTHSPRIYDLQTTPQKGKSGLLDNAASRQRKNIADIESYITDQTYKNPYLASAGRLELALRNKANLEALDGLSKTGQILDNAPNKNFAPLVGEKYGQYQGKYVDKQLLSQLEGKDFFNTEVGQAIGDFTRAYAQSPLGQIDKALKTSKTALTPAVGAGNIVSNITAFSGAANINPVTTAARMAQAGEQLYKHAKGFDPNVYRAEKAGLFSGNTGKQLLGISDTDVAIKAKKSYNPIKVAMSFYGNTDKAAALGMFNELKARGLSDSDAVRRVHAAIQNYDNAGRAINTLADSPVLGKPFARFSPELLRIAKNNVIYNPVGTAAKIGGLAAGLTLLSKKAGETEQERKAREEAVGQTQLPGTYWLNKATGGPSRNVSLNVPIGESSVNVARLTGLNFPIEPNGDSNSALLRQLSPVADMTRTTADGNTVFAPNQAVSSLLFRPIADQIANRDFMGRQISDPSNKVYSEIGKGKSEYENPDGSRQSPGRTQELKNRKDALLAAYFPSYNETNSIESAAKGKEDFYGKKRTLFQGILRAGGLKVESNDKAAREKRVSIKDFYEGEDKKVKEFLRANPDKADDYFKLNNSSRDRFTNKKTNSLVTPERWSIINSQTDDKLFNQLKQEAIDSNAKDSTKPIDPIFQLNDNKRVKQVMSIRASAPGDNVEKEEILRATTSWYKPFENSERDYYAKNSAWYDKLKKGDNPALPNDRAQSYFDVPHPEQPAIAKKYLELRYGNEEKGIAPNEQAGKNFYKANADELSKSFSEYKDARLKEINSKRAILGLDPIDKDTYNNVTFGYEDDEAKVAKELYYKLGGSGYNNYKNYGNKDNKPNVSSVAKYFIDESAGGKAAKASISVKAPSKAPVAKKGSSKPKVSIKKSRV